VWLSQLQLVARLLVCLPFCMCFLLLLFPSQRISSLLQFTVSLPPSTLSSQQSLPHQASSLLCLLPHWIILWFVSPLPEFTVLDRFCPCPLPLTFMFPKISHDTSSVLLLLPFISLYLKSWYVTWQCKLIKKLVATGSQIYQCSLVHRRILPENVNYK